MRLNELESMRAELQGIYDTYAKKYFGEADFPRGCCEEISRYLEKTYGFKRVNGWFITDGLMPDTSEIGWKYRVQDHDWCLNENKVVDLTASQFNPALDNKVPPGVLIIGQDDPFYYRYHRKKNFRLKDYWTEGA